MKRSAIFLTLAAIGALGVYRAEHIDPSSTVFLRQFLPQASYGPILGPKGFLGTFECTPFLDHGWDPLTEQIYRRTLSARPPWSHDPSWSMLARVMQERSRICFYLTQRVPIHVALQGRATTGSSTVQLSLGSAPLGTVELSNEWHDCSVDIPAGDLKEGRNELLLSAVAPTEWRSCTFSPAHCDVYRVEPATLPDKVLAPFGKSIEIPLLLQPSTWLTFDDLSPLIEPGAPGLRSGWTLTVRLQSGEEKLDQSWILVSSHKQSLALRVKKPTRASLSLLAMPNQDTDPGQPGLTLTKPRLETWTKPSTRITPVTDKRALPVSASRPNVLLYLIDTLRSDHLHCYGYEKNITPHIDALAAAGVRFDDCAAQASWTKPATASILTSLLPHEHGAEDFPDAIRPQQHTLAQVLQAAGYQTYGFVNNPMVFSRFGFKQGFDQYVEHWHKNDREEKAEGDAHLTNPRLLPFLDAQSKANRPFFLYVHVVDPHEPYDPPNRFRPKDCPIPSFGKSENRALAIADAMTTQTLVSPSATEQVRLKLTESKGLYDGEIANCDDAFGQLVEALKARGLYDNTMIILVSDHGEQFLEHHLLQHMNSHYQELLHVPLIIKYPQGEAAGITESSTWQQIDIAPTILHRLKLKAPASMAGLPYWPGCEADPDRPVYFSTSVGRDAERFGQGTGRRRFDADGIRVGRWVLNRVRTEVNPIEPIELFDLRTDPQERHNLAYERPEIRTRLLYLLGLGNKSGGAPPPAKVSGSIVDEMLKSLGYL